MNKLLIFLLLFTPFFVLGRDLPFKLSSKGQISVLTCSQGSLLYEAFGHSAIRVYDPENDVDVVFNYGIFNFNQPNYYLNFTKGLLLYNLGMQSYRSFLKSYVPENRTVVEQVLNLSYRQKQQVYLYLFNNALPQNREYLYDYFRNNCATKITAILSESLNDSINYVAQPSREQHSYRSLIEKYTQSNRWGKLGIDLCLGSPIDKKLDDRAYEFLPSYLMSALDSAQLTKMGKQVPLVRQKIVIHNGTEMLPSSVIDGPRWFFWILFVTLSIVALWAFRKQIYLRSFDIIMFGISGLIGLLLLLLWLLTDHQDAAWNYNLLWAFPLNLLIPIFMVLKKHKWLINYYFFMGALLTALALFWTFLPQVLNPAFFPVVLMLLYRCAINCYRYLYHLPIVRSI